MEWFSRTGLLLIFLMWCTFLSNALLYFEKPFALPKAREYLCRAKLKINPFALPKAKEKMFGLLFQVFPIINKNVILSPILFYLSLFLENGNKNREI